MSSGHFDHDPELPPLPPSDSLGESRKASLPRLWTSTWGWLLSFRDHPALTSIYSTPAHLASVLCQGLGERADRQTEMVPELLEFPSASGVVDGGQEKLADQECCRSIVMCFTNKAGW